MKSFIIPAVLFAAAFAAEPEDDWKKVMALSRGTEVRLTGPGIKSTLEGKVDQVNDEAIVLMLRNEQRSVLKEEIATLDFRNVTATRKLTKDSKVSTDDTSANPIPPRQRLPGQSAVPRNMSSTTSVTLPTRAPWEPLYRVKQKPAKRDTVEK
jgi:hypothetical protein